MTSSLICLAFIDWALIPAWLPGLLGALALLGGGWALASYLSKSVGKFATARGLDESAERLGLTKLMGKLKVTAGPTWILQKATFWLVIVLAGMAAFSILGLPPLASFMSGLVYMIPRILIASAVVAVGYVLGDRARRRIQGLANEDAAGLLLADVAYWVIFAGFAIAATEHMGLEFRLISNIILLVFAGGSIGLGVALGLGGKEVFSGVLAGLLVRRRLQIGDRVRVAEYEGSIREFGPLATVVETNEDGLMQRRSIPNVKMLNEAVR